MIDYILNFQFNSLLGLLLYWLPLSLCVFGYTVRTANDYMYDKNKRDGTDGSTYYSPDLTIGTIVGRAIASIVPVANLWAALFDVAPKMFTKFFTFIGDMFDMPLVPDSKAFEAKRKSTNSK